MKDKIPVNKAMIPYRFDILMGSQTFTLEFNYNATMDLFTVSVYQAGVLKCADEPIIYGLPLWDDCFMVNELPCLTIIPMNESNGTDKVTWENFGETVFLCIDDE